MHSAYEDQDIYLGYLPFTLENGKFQLENHMVHATACYDFCDLRPFMFSTLFSLSQLILMSRSSTIKNLIVKWVCTEAYNS